MCRFMTLAPDRRVALLMFGTLYAAGVGVMWGSLHNVHTHRHIVSCELVVGLNLGVI